MDSSSRSNGSKTRPPAEPGARSAGRSRVAGRIDRVIANALAGESSTVLNVTSQELLSEAQPVAATIERALVDPDAGLRGHHALHDLLRRSLVYDALVDALQSPNSLTRAAAARICGAARMTDAVVWLGDLLNDPTPAVREAAVRGLALHGGRRAVD